MCSCPCCVKKTIPSSYTLSAFCIYIAILNYVHIFVQVFPLGQCLQRPEEGVWSAEAGVRGNWELLDMLEIELWFSRRAGCTLNQWTKSLTTYCFMAAFCFVPCNWIFTNLDQKFPLFIFSYDHFYIDSIMPFYCKSSYFVCFYSWSFFLVKLIVLFILHFRNDLLFFYFLTFNEYSYTI